MDLKFHHIGIAVFNIKKTASYYTKLGYTINHTIFDPLQQVNICFLEREGEPLLELIEPVNDKSPIAEILKKNGVSPYHFCYSIKNIEDSIADLKAEHFLLINKPVNAVALGNRKVCFLYNKDMGLIELVEE